MSINELGLIRYPDSELFVCPSIHHDAPVFADLVIAACETAVRDNTPFDWICVELPHTLDAMSMTDAVARLWPSPGVAICDAGPAAEAGRIRTEDLDGAEGEPVEVRRGSVIPISPTDSICAAIYGWTRMRKAGHEVGLAFIDLPEGEDEQRHRKPVPMPDSCLVARKGLQAYIDSVSDLLEIGRAPDDDARELAMAGRLRRLMEQNQDASSDRRNRILFVCGMSHWTRIRSILAAGPTVPHGIPAESSRQDPVKTFALPAPQAWMLGYLGIPALTADLVTHWERGGGGTYDLPGAVLRLQREAMAEAQATEGLALTPRQAMAFEEYLHNLLLLAGRMTPRLDGDLCAAAQATAGDFASTLKEFFLRYPEKRPAAFPEAGLLQHGGGTYLVAGKRAYPLRSRTQGCDDFEKRSLTKGPRVLTEAERRKAGSLPCRRSAPQEDRLQREAIRWAWKLADWHCDARRRRGRQIRSTRYTGDLGSGVDVRRTLREWRRGRPTSELYVRIPSRRGKRLRGRNPQPAPSEAWKPCPVVWMFDAAAPVAHTAASFMLRTYSSFYFCTEVASLPGGIGRERLAAAVHVLRGRPVHWDEASVRNLLATLPDSQKPNVRPWDDPALSAFQGPGSAHTCAELACAAAIRWADDRAVIVADDSFCIPLGVEAYARKRGVKLVKLSWSLFGEDSETRRRMAVNHTCPCQSWYKEEDIPPFVLAAIPRVQAFNPPRVDGLDDLR